jgi:2-(1,2-epoxy-1,2-dihydrophenyl)acetyl-CoA isomerase
MALVNLEHSGRIAIIRLSDPAMLNAMSVKMVEEVRAALRDLKHARALVVTGEGRAFCSGAALGSVGGGDRSGQQPKEFDAGAALESHYNPMMMELRNLDMPFVTAVHGAAAGVGCSVALMGDLIVADETAYFLQAFRNIGLVPDGGSPYLLASSAGRARAMEAMLLGDRIPAAKAYEWGMVNRLVPEGQDVETAIALAERLAEGPRATLGLIRRLAWGALDNGFEDQLNAERDTQREAGKGAEFREGVKAFLEKRKADFTGLA